MERTALSLKRLEVFQAVSRSGSVRDGAAELGLSVSTTSHHLACLERAVGAWLLDHARRPMRLTAEGATLLRRVDEALALLRKGVSEIWTEDLSAFARRLRIATVEDFETDLGPELAARLSAGLPGCTLSFLTRPSHDVLELIKGEQADIGIASSPEADLPGIVEVPLLRDPFLLVTPPGVKLPSSVGDLAALSQTLPFLRYSQKQLMGRRIAAQLARQGLDPPGRMNFESTHPILSMVASGKG